MTTRLRKVRCADCGYTARITRSWLQVGLPTCPCGGQLEPDAPADLALCGIIGQADMPAPQWTAICRENGWDDMIVRRGGAAKAYERQRSQEGYLHAPGAAHCAYAGCGRWVAKDADRCSAGHAQSDDAPALEAMPF